MTGPKTNERPGVRAHLGAASFSAYKAREVLDLIRNKPIAEARGILELTQRQCSEPILKLLDSAVANAGNNNDIPADELFISACYADEGTTLRRFRPRAKGRGTRTRKRTCKITIIVSRLTQDDLDRIRERNSRRGVAPADVAASRAKRVARSRRSGEAAAAAEAEAAELENNELETDETDTETVETEASEATALDSEDTGATEPDAADAAEEEDSVADDTEATETDDPTTEGPDTEGPDTEDPDTEDKDA